MDRDDFCHLYRLSTDSSFIRWCLHVIYRGDVTILHILIHVDNILIAGYKSQINLFNIKGRFKIKVLGMIKFALGINISTNVANTSVFYEREFPTPADPSLKLTVDHCCCKTSEDSAYMTDKYYRSLLGSLLYVAMWTRPDILIRLSSVPVFLIYTLGPCTLESSSTHRWVYEKDRYSWFCLR